VQQSIRNHIREVSQLDPWLREHPPDVSFFGFAAEPTIYNLDTPLFDALQVNHQDLTGTLLTTGPSAATIDNRFFQLYYDIPTVVYGALGGALHAPDEWVDLDSLRKATAVLAGTIVDWCGVE
jgi:acetylornithine deacetylase